jgi:hypothetical protein
MISVTREAYMRLLSVAVGSDNEKDFHPEDMEWMVSTANEILSRILVVMEVGDE